MIPSGSSWLIGVKVKRVVGRAHSMNERVKQIIIQKLHYMMGHTGKHLINPTTKYLGIQTTGKLNPCEHSARGKIRQANIPTISKNQQAKIPGERIFIAISSMMHPTSGGKKHWLLIVDEATDYTHSFFLKKKSDLVETMIIWIKNLFMRSYQIQENQVG